MTTKPRTAPASVASPALTRVYAWFSAIIAEDMPLLEDLFTHGVPIDVFHPLRHTTALMEATRLGRTRCVGWLLHHGAAPAFLCGMPLGTPLHSALCRRHWHIAQMLISRMNSVALTDAYGRSPLHILCMEAQSRELGERLLDLASVLIEKNCPLDALDHEGITPLHHCVINDALPLAELLLTHGANVDALIPDSWVSPLTIAALEKNNEMVDLLLRHGANPQLRTREGSCPATIYPELVTATP